jgi:DNA-binding CsgD family transcriptional regulator
VKSHVRAILHRVGAVNRAEAIARYVAQDRSRG